MDTEAKMAEADNTLAQRASGPLSKQDKVVTIGLLERALLKRYPAEDAEDWDRTGLAVGDPALQVDGVAVALDATVDAIRETKALGKNVLVTHHPLFLEAPDTFAPAPSTAYVSGAAVWAAIEEGIAVMSFHTALDTSTDAAKVLPSMLSLQYKGVIDPLEGSRKKGYGQLCTVKAADAPLTLEKLGARCTAVFGRQPRIWGNFAHDVKNVATCTGSAGDLTGLCVKADVDCLICGEIRYHDALAAAATGLGIIELGHDVSELPLAAVLAAAVEAAGIRKETVTILDQDRNWSYPESTRV